MHRAPAVTFPVERSHWHARLIVGLSLLAGLTCAVFAWEQAALDVRSGLLACALCMASSAAWLGWWQSPQGSLHWDGQDWHWSGFAANPACRLGLLMDFQRVVLVTVKADGQKPVCLWLEGMTGDARWRPLRRAIVSSQVVPEGKASQARPGAEGNPA